MMIYGIKKINRRNVQSPRAAMTLTELLVASIIVGLIIVGVFSVDHAMRSSREIATKTAQAQMQLSAAILRINQAAMKTTGHLSSTASWEEEGIFVSHINNVGDTICFRYDADDIPENYDGDHWRCFQQDLLSTSSHWQEIWTCDIAVDPYSMPCATTDAANLILPRFHYNLTDYFTIQRDTNSRIEYVEIELRTRPFPAKSVNPMTNPEISLTTRIRPPGLSQ